MDHQCSDFNTTTLATTTGRSPSAWSTWPSSFLYFAYGSNMCSIRIRQRNPSAVPVGTGKLTDHRLRFGYFSDVLWNGEHIELLTYQLTDKALKMAAASDNSVRSAAYKRVILRGAVEHQLPPDYVQQLELFNEL